MTPAYLKTFRRAVEELEGRAKSALSAKRVGLNTLNTLNTHLPALQKPFADDLAALEARCPDYIDPNRWQQCLIDAQRFLAEWGEKAATLGWTEHDLFGLAPIPDKPKPSFERLSRYDLTGLIWLLDGRRVIAMTDSSAAIETARGGTLTYRRYNKPALGPLGDSLDDMEARR